LPRCGERSGFVVGGVVAAPWGCLLASVAGDTSCAEEAAVDPLAEAGSAHLRAGFTGLGRLRLILLESLDQVSDVSELLLEVALVLLEPLEDALRLVPAMADAVTTEVSASVMHVHPLPSA
jgi:hypothetical protein